VTDVADRDDTNAAFRLDANDRHTGVADRHLEPGLGIHAQRSRHEITDDVAVAHEQLAPLGTFRGLEARGDQRIQRRRARRHLLGVLLVVDLGLA
jgi:hypothetical protein